MVRYISHLRRCRVSPGEDLSLIHISMLSQILSTFGLALLLRYTAFWIFSANFVSLPQTSLAGTIKLGGIFLPVAQLVAGAVAVVLTLALHLLLTRTTTGSKLLAVAEDRAAAMLMGIRPDRMQALAWGLSAGAAGIAGALMATAYPWSPSVGETFGLIAFVVVALGGFGSVLGSLYAGDVYKRQVLRNPAYHLSGLDWKPGLCRNGFTACSPKRTCR